MDTSYSEIMEFLASPEMNVADHFMAARNIDDKEQRRIIRAATKTGVVCEICFAYFKDDTGLWLHARWQHPKDMRLVCPVLGCGKRFVAREHRNQHMAHHGGFREADKTDGKGRRYVPTVARPPTCELCGRLSVNNKMLRKHVSRAHPQARPYTCGVCWLLVRDMTTLARHVRCRHADVLYGNDTQRAIRCDVCGQEFGNYALVKSHKLTHGVVFGSPDYNP